MPHLSIDELDVVRTLSITIASAILCTSLVTREPAHSTVRVHCNEVHGTVESTWKLGHVHIEREFLIQHAKHLVLALALEKVDTRANILAVVIISDKLESQGIAACGNAISG